jgi:hypothetical protein
MKRLPFQRFQRFYNKSKDIKDKTKVSSKYHCPECQAYGYWDGNIRRRDFDCNFCLGSRYLAMFSKERINLAGKEFERYQDLTVSLGMDEEINIAVLGFFYRKDKKIESGFVSASDIMVNGYSHDDDELITFTLSLLFGRKETQLLGS